ncbi:holin [Arthrobacter phage RosiePosie]|uniref:Holin n=12 Tax=Klausavirus princesstrina TaxID=1984784 RepID=A0A286N445_9CAUD|nr:holin [Arthrobacter phage PrincessTrina]AOZ64585.1 holin [Arthrobacter phage Chubster]AOZ64697.1 holin [Arthrobacter phage Chocolat]APC44827.1 holin [Arthrobacter phage HumptyDumpty]ASX98817.1 holin [Arthrobacter phage Kabreeze]ASX98928.1 holin [Arthrobacter phage RosiePosie]ASX99040.1 holin [Arthrobacter phage Scavito]ASX99152.1 holin [Arthrobacter phage Tophat]ASZ73243.1 holin [Arthrobacter phage JayCookie]QBP30403.1 holin [Arthrobacter phage Chipper1996]QEQ94138.1 holin [Arthrobacte
MIVFDIPQWQFFVQLFGGTVMTLLVGLVTTRVTASSTRALLLAALSVLSSIVTELVAALQTNTPYNLGTALAFGLLTFLVAVGTHYGLLKHTSLETAAQSVLIKASAREVEAAEQDKARELLAKAGVATIATDPAEGADVLRVADARYVPRHSSRE